MTVRKVRKTMILDPSSDYKTRFSNMVPDDVNFWYSRPNEAVRKIHIRRWGKESKWTEVPAKYQSGGLEQALRSSQLSNAWTRWGLSYVKLTMKVLEFFASQLNLEANFPLILVTLAQRFRSVKDSSLNLFIWGACISEESQPESL